MIMDDWQSSVPFSFNSFFQSCDNGWMGKSSICFFIQYNLEQFRFDHPSKIELSPELYLWNPCDCIQRSVIIESWEGLLGNCCNLKLNNEAVNVVLQIALEP